MNDLNNFKKLPKAVQQEQYDLLLKEAKETVAAVENNTATPQQMRMYVSSRNLIKAFE